MKRKLFSALLFSISTYYATPLPVQHNDANITQKRYLQKMDQYRASGGAGSYWSNYEVDNKMVQIRVITSTQLSSKYRGECTLDGRFDTAWVEGKKDSGKGEWIRYRFVLKPQYAKSNYHIFISRVAIFGGLGVKKYFKKNNRIKSMMISVKIGQRFHRQRFVLQDKFIIQEFSINYPDFEGLILTQDNPKAEVTLYIESVYPGTKWNDTPISEVIFTGFAEQWVEPE